MTEGAALPTASEEAKRRAAQAALAYVPEAGILGLGTGSTTRYFIEAVAELVAGGRRLQAVPTSEQSRELAARLGIPLLDNDGPWEIAVCVDGADEVSATLDLIKGGGGAHTREKIVNFAARKNVIIIDGSKLSDRLGEKRAVPVEVLAFAHLTTAHALTRFGRPTLRRRGEEPFRTDSGNYIYDLAVEPIQSPALVDNELRRVPGVVETGLFCGRADLVLVAEAQGIRQLVRAP
ncbi:MAG TPA: ribose-5-phosphate isomerase RpiA [Polyangiaceae bacterium]|jgi:ribose 5-phosphate isomerase A